MQVHADLGSPKSNPLKLEPEALLATFFSRERDPAPGRDHAMPR